MIFYEITKVNDKILYKVDLLLVLECNLSIFRKLPSIYVFSYFPFGFEGRMWDLIVSVPDRCLSFYFPYMLAIMFYLRNI